MPQAQVHGRSFSLRVKFLAIVLGAALAPLTLLGFWLAHSSARSGEQLLRTRLDTALTRVARDVGSRWVRERSALLAIAENIELRQALTADGRETAATITLPAIGAVAEILKADVEWALVRDVRQRPRWVLAPASDSAPLRLVPPRDTVRLAGGSRGDGVSVVLPITAPRSSQNIGTIEVRVRTSAIIENGAANAAGAGAVLATVDRSTGALLTSLPFDPSLLGADRFTWTGEEWLAIRRELDEPPITLIAAAPIAPFIAPFAQAARVSSWTIVGFTIGAFLVALVLTGRVTRSLEELVSAADAVSRGDLDRRVDVSSGDEIGRVADAFNTMTESLRRTLRQLSQHEAVAAVGELASTLAHEVRNPLSAIRLHLQHVEERLTRKEPFAESVAQALRGVDRLERTVAGTLRIAQSGRMEMQAVDLRVPLNAAYRGAAPEFVSRDATLEPLANGGPPMCVNGNSAALEQLFLNLLLNAAQALEPGGRAGVELSTSSTDHTLIVWDTGRGLTGEARARAFEPFYSTKAEGTGLGLAIVRRIVSAHAGRVEIEGVPSGGTRVRATLPRNADG